jgi:sugar lactone lactonase YvrE
MSPFALKGNWASGKVYWSDSVTQSIWRADTDGSAVEEVVAAGMELVRSIALDHGRGKLYWTDSSTGKVQRANLDGTGVEDLFVSSPAYPLGLDIDSASGRVYWSDPRHHELHRFEFDGSDHQVVLTFTAGPGHIALDLPTGVLYYLSDNNADLHRVRLEGTGDTWLAELHASGLALDLRTLPGDCTRDGDVSLTDYEWFADCMTGPGVELSFGCGCDDLNGDLRVDLADYAAFQNEFTSP